ncbi:MAG: hypothetical protein O2960_12455 [Verrucomicrobia bacterium]|nr:hypothetical protein [Verrucomicrobiota bacterium]
MKTQTILKLALALMTLVLCNGCKREIELKTVAADDEQIEVNAPVLLDGAIAGYVKALRAEADQRIAILALPDTKATREKLKLGAVRILEKGRIDIRTDQVTEDSPALTSQAFIPKESQPEDFTRSARKRYASEQTLVFAGIALVAAVLLCLVFKSAFKLGLVLICLAAAALVGWVLHPRVVPSIEKYYASSQAMHDNTGANLTTPPSHDPASAPVNEWETRFVMVLEHRPNPRVVAFAAVFLASFFVLAILLGSALRALRSVK